MRCQSFGYFPIILLSCGVTISHVLSEDTPETNRPAESARGLGNDERRSESDPKSKRVPIPVDRDDAPSRTQPEPADVQFRLLPYRKPAPVDPRPREESEPKPKFKPAPKRPQEEAPSDKPNPSRPVFPAPAQAPQSDEAGFPIISGAKPLTCPCTQSEARAAQRDWAAALDVPTCWLNRFGIEFCLIPPGEYLQGSTAEELAEARRHDSTLTPQLLAGERTTHKVRITRPFYISSCEITVEQFRAFTKANSYWTEAETSEEGGEGLVSAPAKKGENETKQKSNPKPVAQRQREFHWRNPGFEQGEDEPVVNVTLRDAEAFCAWLSRQEHCEHRLPSEVEWEYAARSGERRDYFPPWGCWAFAGYANIAPSDAEDAVNDRHEFTSYAFAHEPNNWSVRDMIGNVWELCYESAWPPASPSEKSQAATAYVAPRMLTGNAHAMIRGGSFRHSIGQCRAAFRNPSRSASERAKPACDVGFRVIIPIALPPVLPDGTRAVSRPSLEVARQFAAERQDEWAKQLKQPVELTNSVGIPLRLIPPGDFSMGNPFGNHCCHWEEFLEAEGSDNIPVRTVRITRPFYAATDAVTQRAYHVVMGRNPSDTQGDQLPVTNVTWEDAREFCRRLNERPQEKSAGRFYRLPTEAEREYFTRAGTTTRYWYGNDDEFLTAQEKSVLNDDEQSKLEAKRCAEWNSKPNPFGLFHLDVGSYRHPSGVREWCNELYAPYGHSDKSFDDPTGPLQEDDETWLHRVLRGSSDSAGRDHENQDQSDKTIGFRVVMVLKQNRTAVVEPLPSSPSAKSKSAQPR